MSTPKALTAARRGWHVFPIVDGTKRPACKWTSGATSDPERVGEWAEDRPAYGIACGPSGLVVLDEDEPGELDRWRAATGLTLPETFTVVTGRGRHHYFTQPEGEPLTNHSRFQLEGYRIDVRGAGGYVLGPGSAHPDGGTYAAENRLRPAPMPEDVAEWMRAGASPQKAREATQKAGASPRSESTPQPARERHTSPFDDFDDLIDWEHVLEGWTLHHEDADGTRYWTRPGKDVGEGWSATTDRPGGPSRLFVFSTSTPLRPQVPYRKAVAWAVLNGYAETPEGLRAAAAQLKGWGYGSATAAEEFTPQGVGMTPTPGGLPSRQRPEGRRAGGSPRSESTPPPALVSDIVLTPATSVKVRRPRWLKRGWYPLDVVTIVAGRGGEGKSTLVLADVADLTRGLLDGDTDGPRTVVISAIEDEKGLQRARLAAAGADLSRVYFLDLAVLDPATGEVLNEGAPRIPHHLPSIREQLKAAGASVWVIDPLTAVVPGDLNAREDVRAALDPLTALARELDIAVVGICHFNKGPGNASNKLAGSAAFRDVARSVVLVAHDPDSGERVATIDKSNYGDSAGKSFGFTLESADTSDDEGGAFTVPRVRFLGETRTSVDEIINRQSQPIDNDRKDVEAWLVAYLTEQGGKAAFQDIRKAAKAEGWTEDQVKKARARGLRDLIRYERLGYPAKSFWSLDFSDTSSGEGDDTDQPGRPVVPLSGGHGTTGTTGEKTPTFPSDSKANTVGPQMAPLEGLSEGDDGHEFSDTPTPEEAGKEGA